VKVRWLVTAADDLEAISTYLYANAPAIAQKTLTRLFEGITSLEHSPLLGRPAKHGTRELIFRKERYIATYRVESDAIHVIGIRHTSRMPLR
jgi:plasmid stabilization system protein ParE